MQAENIGMTFGPLLPLLLVQCVPKWIWEWTNSTICFAISSLEESCPTLLFIISFLLYFFVSIFYLCLYPFLSFPCPPLFQSYVYLHISFSSFLLFSLFSLHSFYVLDFSFFFPCPSLVSHLSSSSITSISSIFISILTLHSFIHSLFYLPSLFFHSFIIIVVKFYCVT